MGCYNVMSILTSKRMQIAPTLQEILTESGCIIKTRLGLHDVGDSCSNEGLIILQLVGSDEEIQLLEDTLNKLEGVKAKNNKLTCD